MKNTVNRRTLLGVLGVVVVIATTNPWAGRAHAYGMTDGHVATGVTGPDSDPIPVPVDEPTGTENGDSTPGTHEPGSVPPGRAGGSLRTRWRKVVVDLSEQKLTVYDDTNTFVLTWPVSSGAPKTPTPTGRYRVGSRSRNTFAAKNPEVTMEHMVRFNGGIGFHSIPRLRGTPLWTPLGERGVSHGCIRLADSDARTLYRNLPAGAIVIVKP